MAFGSEAECLDSSKEIDLCGMMSILKNNVQVRIQQNNPIAVVLVLVRLFAMNFYFAYFSFAVIVAMDFQQARSCKTEEYCEAKKGKGPYLTISLQLLKITEYESVCFECTARSCKTEECYTVKFEGCYKTILDNFPPIIKGAEYESVRLNALHGTAEYRVFDAILHCWLFE